MTDRDLLTNVPVEASNKNDKMKIYRHHQFLHMLRNYGEILDATPISLIAQQARDSGLGADGEPRRG